MHSRSIEFAKKYGVPIHVRSSFSDSPGTWIVAESEARRLGTSVSGAALAKDEARVTVQSVPDRPGVVHSIFKRIAEANIVVDMIVQNVSTAGSTEVSFTVATGDLHETLRVAESAAREIGAGAVTHDPDVAKVSVVGLGMRTHTGVATIMFDALAAARVNIQMITTSEIKISVLVARPAATTALRAVHKAFGLERSIADLPESYTPKRIAVAPRPSAENGNGPSTPPGMEDLVISGAELDDQQARVTLLNLTDQPGYAAKVFRRIAEAEVFVDMIVQNAGTAGNTHLSFTVPRHQAQRAAEAIEALAGPGGVLVEQTLAKLSVLGVGVRTHTGAATRMFRMFGALAERGINISLINTSEVRINVATDLERGQEGLECLRKAFDLPAEPA
jgi:aspartate kinase